MILLHAIVPRDASDVSDGDLRRHAAGEVAVLYEQRDEPPTRDRAAVLAHGRRVVALAEHVPVLPVRYGTTLPDLDELTAAVAEHADAWSRWLARLAGRCELVVHVDVAADADAATADGSGRAYLLRRMEQVKRQDRAFDGVSSALSPWAEEIRMLTDRRRLAVLVQRHAADTACDEVSRWAAQHDDVEVLVTGPWPPFSFCEEAALS